MLINKAFMRTGRPANSNTIYKVSIHVNGEHYSKAMSSYNEDEDQWNIFF